MLMLRDSRPPSRRGFTVTEIVVTTILLGALIALIAPLSKRAIDVRRQTQARRAALVEVSNALERMAADPSARPAAGEERTAALSDPVAGRLREPRLVVAAVSVDGPPPGLRLDASLTWSEPTGGRSAPVRLSAFVFDPGAEGATP